MGVKISDTQYTVKFLNFWMPEIFAVNTLKIKFRMFYHGLISLDDANGMTSSKDHLGAV